MFRMLCSMFVLNPQLALGRHPVVKPSCTPAELEYLHGAKTTK